MDYLAEWLAPSEKNDSAEERYIPASSRFSVERQQNKGTLAIRPISGLFRMPTSGSRVQIRRT